MSITYFCTDQHGHTYERHSAGHNQQIYTHAVVRRSSDHKDAVPKSCVSYHGSRRLADQAAGYYRFPSEVVLVRAYPGRHKVEPKA